MRAYTRFSILTREVPPHRIQGSLAASLILIAALIVVGCEVPPTAPTASEVAALDTPASASKAARDRQHFELTFPDPGIPAPSPCLGGTFFITGTISGWSQNVVTPNGYLHFTEHVDFSQLTASFGGRTWTAQPGSHEIWSGKVSLAGDAMQVVVHEGRSRFVADDGGGPRITFVHRIHRLVLPNGDLQHHDETFEALCMGGGA